MEVSLLFTMWFSITYTTPAFSKIIAIKDHSFVGEDLTLTEELARRMGLNATFNPPIIKEMDIGLPEYLTIDESTYINRTLRRTGYDNENDPHEYTLNFKILDMMRQDVYSTQFRIGHLHNKLKRYFTTPDFRLSYIFGKLEEWLYDMKVIWTVASKPREFNNDEKLRRFRVYKQMLYYAHMLRRDVDITYTVEELIKIHNKIYKKKKITD